MIQRHWHWQQISVAFDSMMATGCLTLSVRIKQTCVACHVTMVTCSNENKTSNIFADSISILDNNNFKSFCSTEQA